MPFHSNAIRVLAVALAEPLVRDVHDIAIYRHGDKVSVSLHSKTDPDVPLAARARRQPHVVNRRRSLGTTHRCWSCTQQKPRMSLHRMGYLRIAGRCDK